MVIDDDEDLRRAMVELFTEIGFVVEAARDGQAALDRLRAMPEAPGLILLDLSMPVMDGASFRVEQRREASLRGIPVILVTADADAEQRAKALGVEGYLRKPVGAGELAQLVARYCSGEAP